MEDKPTILIVDDTPSIRLYLSQLFSREDFTVLVASSPEEALETVKAYADIDMILLDINLQTGTGFSVLEAIHANPRTQQIRVIMATGIHDESQIVRAFQSGAVDYVTKPFNNSELIARVKTHLHLKNMETELKQQKELYRSTLEHTSDTALLLIESADGFIAHMNRDGVLNYVSPACHKVLGFQPEDIQDKHLFELVHPEDREDVESMEPSLFDISNSTTFSLRLRKSEGDFVWVEIYFQPSPQKEQTLIAVIRDISERKKYEQALQQAYDEMEQRVRERTTQLMRTNNLFKQEIIDRKRAEFMLEKERADLALRVEERTAELSTANKELQRANQLKDEFLASMSHELRTPLNAVLGLTESLLEGVYGEISERQINALQIIDESGQHLRTLINDILDLSKIGAGKLTLGIEPVSVQDVCVSSLNFINDTAAKKNIDISSSIDPAVTTIPADQRRLKQILINLLSNAVKFTPEGGKIGLTVQGNSYKDVVQFTVWDTGIGIAESQLEHLFEPFVQLDSKLSRRYSGTGLGLTLVQRMTEMHGGNVIVLSQPGQGSQFTITLPWKKPDIKPAPVPEVSSGVAPHILLVDDSIISLQTIYTFLKKQGYHISVAKTGLEALKLAIDIQPNLILMDIGMPEMDGLEATRRIRMNPRSKHIPVIAVTAMAMPGDKERCLAAGANNYLSKPINLKALKHIISGYMD